MKSSIYTRTGDAGITSLADGTHLPKHSLRLEAYGTLDEANANVGLAMAMIEEIVAGPDGESDSNSLRAPLHTLHQTLTFLANRLFNCCSVLAHGRAIPAAELLITEQDVDSLEQAIDFFDEHSGALAGFILCGGSPPAAQLHVARTVMRRAERLICNLFETENGDAQLLRFVNRSSDFLFAAARYVNFLLGERDVTWERTAAFPPLKK